MAPSMTITLAIFACLICVLISGSYLWRWSDHRADAVQRSHLLAFQPATPALFDPAMIEHLPEPARRYFLFTIAPNTPLYTVADISMVGQFSLGTKDAPNYMQMRAQQTLAAPHGFVWEMSASRGPLRISGSDSGSWTRFWAMGLIPVARLGGNPDHARSAFGRYVAEAVFWTPAALLPGPGIDWEPVDATTARVVITHGGLQQAVELSVDAAGCPRIVRFLRWSDANAAKVYRLQPFGGYLSEFRTFAGFTLPTHVEAGNHFETDEYFPFFCVDVSDVRFTCATEKTVNPV